MLRPGAVTENACGRKCRTRRSATPPRRRSPLSMMACDSASAAARPRHFVRLLGERVAAGLARRRRRDLAPNGGACRDVGVPLATLDETPELDLDVDGADEIGPSLALIEGGGGALLKEKIVANASRRMIVIADAGKRVAALGAFPLPIEVVAFGLTATTPRNRRARQRARPERADQAHQEGPGSRLSPTAATAFSTHLLAAFPTQKPWRAAPRASRESLSTGCSSALPTLLSSRRPRGSRS